MNLTLIAAMSENRVIGRDNDLPWHLPKDLKRFKELTRGHHIIMGRKTFESIGKPLPKRTNVIVTRQKDYRPQGCMVVNTLEDAIRKAEGDSQPFVVGGGQIYRQALEYADTIELTLVHQTFSGDTYFPDVDEDIWKLVNVEQHEADDQHACSFDFLTYKRK